jgi:hypothetical protein
VTREANQERRGKGIQEERETRGEERERRREENDKMHEMK